MMTTNEILEANHREIIRLRGVIDRTSHAITAKELLEYIGRSLEWMNDEEYKKMWDITQEGSENFVGLGLRKCQEWLEGM